MAKKYREKPYNAVEAVQWTGENISEVRNFTIKNLNGVAEQCSYLSSSSLFIMEPDKDVEVSRNDYIIKGVDGEFYVCEQDVFEKVYEEVKESELANELKKANAKVDALEKRISDMNHNSEIEKVRKIYGRLKIDERYYEDLITYACGVKDEEYRLELSLIKKHIKKIENS